MEIPELNISVTKAAVNGQVVDVISYEEYVKNYSFYSERADIAIIEEYNGKEILLPYKGKYNGSEISPGIYNAGCVDFYKYPEDIFLDRYNGDNKLTMSNTTDIQELIRIGEEAKKLDEPFITTPDNITNFPIMQDDQPEMKALKMALNSKHIDLDKYGPRFGDNYPNDKRQLKSHTATLNIIKRYCANCDMEAVLTLKNSREDVPNPMMSEISISLTNTDDIYDDIEEDSSEDKDE